MKTMNLREFLEVTYGKPVEDPVAKLRSTIKSINDNVAACGMELETRGGTIDLMSKQDLEKIKLSIPACLTEPERWTEIDAYIAKASENLEGKLGVEFLD